MPFIHTIRFFYIVYTVYVLLLVGATTIGFFHSLLSLAVMWINYQVFRLGYARRRRIPPPSPGAFPDTGWLERRSRFALAVIAILSVVSSILAVNYYTGQTPVSTFQGLGQQVSLYHQYQEHFKTQQRYIFILEKMPYILNSCNGHLGGTIIRP